MNDFISIKGARVHNLKDVSLDIPHDKLTVMTGVSGSGKSSLAFDTIYAEGQRRYVESLSAYARQFLERMEKPDVDEIEGIAPPVAIRQKNTTRNPRSTVATSTELYDFLRLLWARAGRTYCPNDGLLVERDTVDQVAVKIMALPEGSRWYALFPVQHEKSADALRDRLFELRKKGFDRLYQAGRVFEFSTPESLLDVDFSQPVYALVDRLAISPGMRQRLVDTVEICYREAGEIILQPATGGEPLRFNEKFQCKTCLKEFVEPEPSLFSFNSPFGACKRCQGFGNTIDYDMELVIPDRTLSIEEGAVDPWTKPQHSWYMAEFRKAVRGKVRLTVPFYQLRPAETALVYDHVRRFFKWLDTKKYKVHVRVFMSRYRGYTTCPDCGGSRLRPEALYIRVGGKTMAEVVKLNIAEALQFFLGMELSPEEAAIADKILVEIRQRLKFLNDVGLEYLTLDRLSSTLSGGEAQRIQLATCLGSRLVGACYVLDEPSIGLHSRDTGRLIRILEELRDLGNTILVVEHDPDVMRAADHIVDLGPGAGENGGRIVFEGSFRQLIGNGSTSLTSRYLRGDLHDLAHHIAAHSQSETQRPLPGRAGPQPQRHRRRHSLARDGRDHRRLRLRQIHAGSRRHLPESLVKRMNRETPLSPEIAEEWGTAPEKLTLHKVEKRRSAHPGGAGRSIAHRPHAALESGDLHQGLRHHSRAFRLHAGGRPPRLHGRAIFPSTFPAAAAKPARATARLPSKCSSWPTSNWSATTAKARATSRAFSTSAITASTFTKCCSLPSRKPCRSFPRRPRLVQRLQRAGRRRPRLSAAGPIRHHAFRRRSAARETGRAPGAIDQRRHAVHLRRAHHRPAFRRHREAAGRLRAAAAFRRQHPDHRTQSRSDPARRLGHRSGAGRRRRAAAASWPKARPSRLPK